MRLYSNHRFPSDQFVRIRLVALAHPRASRSVGRRQPQHKLTESEVAELLAAYRRGTVVRDLASQFLVHRATVTALLRRNGEELRRTGLTTEEIADAARLYAEGWSVARLGQKFCVDGTTAWRALRAAGVSMRSSSRASGGLAPEFR
jgi:lambda repressor-like predicted transcriptional regulator